MASSHPDSSGFSQRFQLTTVVALVLLFCAYTLWVDAGPIARQNLRPTNRLAADGKLLYQQHNCQVCHQIYGLGGYMGPDLTNVYSRGKGAQYIAAFLENGTSRMPNFHLSRHDVAALTAYLETVDSSGNFPLQNYHITWYGSIEVTRTHK